MRTVDTDRLGDEIGELAAHLDAATHRLLTLIRRFDDPGGWADQGALSCAHWLSWRIGLELGAAREHVRVARALAELPLVDDALRRGQVSDSKVRALSRVATPGTEAMRLEMARSSTAAQLERICRGYRLAMRTAAGGRPEDEAAHGWVRERETEDGLVRFDVQLRPDEAAVVRRALEAAMQRAWAGPDVSAGTSPPASVRRADAGGAVAEQYRSPSAAVEGARVVPTGAIEVVSGAFGKWIAARRQARDAGRERPPLLCVTRVFPQERPRLKVRCRGPMEQPDHDAARVDVRSDLRDCHRFLVRHVTAPGTWWTGAERRAIAEESRRSTGCGLCRRRKAALSPTAEGGRHDGRRRLPEEVVDVIHRIRDDPARLSREWFDRVVPAVLEETRYVELVGVVAMTAGLDNFARAMGVPPFALPQARPGEPSRHRPASAKSGEAWVPMIAPEDAVGPEADMYPHDGFVPNIVRALSLVPDEVRALRVSSDAHYVPVPQIPDPSVRRSIDRMQMELVAARVSAMNECFY